MVEDEFVRGADIVGENERAAVDGADGTVAVGFVEAVSAEDVVTHCRYRVDQCYPTYWADEVFVNFGDVLKTSEVDSSRKTAVGGVVLIGVVWGVGFVCCFGHVQVHRMAIIWGVWRRHLGREVGRSKEQERLFGVWFNS